MFWGTIFSVVAVISGVYYSYKRAVPDFIEIVETLRESKSQESKHWWQESIFYRVDLRNYQDSDGDGIGDMRGLIERVPYISELGIDAIWLSPIDAEHENFDDLFKACDQHKIKVVLDLPGNTTQRRKSQEKARLAAMHLLTLSGAPVLQYGEEIGLTEDQPMRWEAGPFSGFSTHRPWTAISEEIESVAEQKENYNDSLYWFYRKLIYLRQENLSLRLGEQFILEHTFPNVLIYSRSYEEKTVWVALNMAEKVVFLRHPSDPKILLSTYQDKSDGLSLKAFEGIVWTY